MNNIFAQPLWTAIIVLAVGAGSLLVCLLIGPRWFHRNFSTVLFLASVAGLAVAVTIMRVAEYRASAEASQSVIVAPQPSFVEPWPIPAAPPRSYAPMTRPADGSRCSRRR